MDEYELRIWDLYFTGVVGWQMHPRNLEKHPRCLSDMLDDAAKVADEMIERRRLRCRGLLAEQ